MTDAALAEPLTTEEAQELFELLTCDAVPERAMSMSALDGYLTGLVCPPKAPPLEAWLKWIWDPEHGRAEPEFARAGDAHRLIELIARHANSTAVLLAEEPATYQPIFEEHDEREGGVTIVDSWCLAFLLAADQDRGGWHALIEAHPDWFREIRLYGTEAGWDELERLDPEQTDDAAHAERVAAIAPAVRKIFAWWSARGPREPLTVPPAVKTVHVAKVGRNEPCPCGSGKKYKQCHGA